MKTLAFFFILISPVFARIGETVTQCDARYGKPQSTDSEIRTYEKAGFDIGVIFRDGKAAVIMMQHSSKDILGTPEKMSETEIDTILKANGGDAEWKTSHLLGLMERAWESSDSKLLAGYDNLKNKLMLMTKEELNRKSEESKAKEKQNLKGF